MSERKTTEQFISEATKIHGDKYDYSLLDYKNKRSKLKIICRIHGVFEQRPDTHLAGSGCRKCYNTKLLYNTETFVKKAKEFHGDKYDYSFTEYVHNRKKIKIICPIHGMFEQRPVDHLFKHGCFSCGRNTHISRGEIEFLNEIKIPESNRQILIIPFNYVVDGFDKNTNTVFEYLGDYWHGNLSKFNASKKIISGYTCKEAHEYTFKRFSDIKSIGYNVKYIWESDWHAWKKNPTDPIPIKEYKD